MTLHNKEKIKPICENCGKEMVEAYDDVAKKFTGYLWKCECMPKLVLSIG